MLIINMDYEKLCSQIFEVDSKIRFAAVYNFWAECLAGGMKKRLGQSPFRKGNQELNKSSITQMEIT